MYPILYMLGLKDFSDGAWFEPSPDNKIMEMIRMLRIQKYDRAIDIGSGDGRIVLALSKAGARAFGIERDSNLVQKSRHTLASAHAPAEIIEGSFWDQDLSYYNKLVVYQHRQVMPRLEKKLLAELKPGSLVVSNYWQLPNWPPEEISGELILYCHS